MAVGSVTSWRLASARELEGPTFSLTAVSEANTGITKAVARHHRQGGPRLPGWLRVPSRPRPVPIQRLPANTAIPR